MNFAVDESPASASSDAKAWRDIWGAGQGIGAIDSVDSVVDIVERLTREYAKAKELLLEG